MKKLVTVTLSFFLFAGMTFAEGRKDATPRPAEPAKPEAAKKSSDPTVASFEAELEELRHKLESQQEELQLLREQLAKRDRQMENARETAGAGNAPAAKSSESAANAGPSAAVHAAEASLSARAGSAEPNGAVPKTAAAQAAAESPVSIRYKGVTITPGAFLAAEAVFRNRAAIADVNTPFNSIPYPGNSQSKVTEFNASGRPSRWSLLVEGKAKNVGFNGYYEADFLSAGTTSNNNQSNSYTFRQRQAFGQAVLTGGWTFTGGQMWSLVTETKKGIQNRQEVPPLVIDHQYNVGFSWARQYGFRIVKTFSDQFSLGFSIEGAQTTLGGRGFSTNTVTGTTITNFFVAAPGVGGGLYSNQANYSFNKTPDFIVKAAFDPKWGHYEIFGVISTYRVRVYPCAVVSVVVPCSINGSTTPSTVGAFNDSRTGGGIGANIRVPVVAKKLDAGIHFFGGDGVGRYGTAGLPDATARPNGTLSLIQARQLLGSLEWHPNPKVDVYGYFGGEYARRTAYTGYITVSAGGTSTTGIGGYGSPFANNSGCSTETPPANQNAPGGGGACAGDTKNILEGTLGFWHRFYNGPIGRLQWGLQYSYVTKTGWSGNNNVPANPGISPKAVDNMVLSSFRYYIP
jgi:hypothetical protein